MEIYLARQPVFDRELNAFAYELLYRSGDVSHAIIEDASAASMQVLVNAFSEFGLETITGGKPALVNITQEILVKGGLPKGLRALLIPEVLETVVVDSDVIREVKGLAELGYKVALDDFVYSDAWKPLLKYADYIKLDVLALGESGVQAQLELLQQSGASKAKLIAEKVENYEQFELYKSMGFDFFQGYFHSKPHTVVGQSILASQQVLLSLISALSNDDYDVNSIAKIIALDPRLPYKLLKVVNSAAFGLPRPVKSIDDTVVFLGSNELRRWAGMLALAGVENKPNELLLTAILRGKLCEMAASYLHRPNVATYFAAGLLSTLDALLDQPMEMLLESMPLADDLKQALLHGEGELGQTLSAIIAYDEARFEQVAKAGSLADKLGDWYLEALRWAEDVNNRLNQS